jgi:hypothetical protein
MPPEHMELDRTSRGEDWFLQQAWTQVQRLVAGIMLVAFASFVLHGSAMARLSSMHTAPGPSVVHGHYGAHDHGAEAHAHGGDQAAADHDGGGKTSGHEGGGTSCCGSYCATAILSPLRPDTTVRVASPVTLSSVEIEVRGIQRDGPRKPPRTPDIA